MDASYRMEGVTRQDLLTEALKLPLAERAELASQLLQTLEDEEDLRDLQEVRLEMEREGTIPWEKAKAELGLK
jgi:hypothetical protein